MGAHGAGGIPEGGAVLNAQAVHRVGVVAAPDLGGVVEHTPVKAPAAAAAPLNEKVGEILAQALQHLIYPQHIAVIDLSLTLRGQGGGPYVGEAAVHVPLDVGDIRAGEDPLQGGIDVVPDLFAGKIQHQLGPSPAGAPAGHRQSPIRVGPVELAVLVDHLRLHPEAEGHPQGLNAGDQGLQTAGELPFVDRPVPQAGGIAVPCAEPAVVQDKELDPQGGGGCGQLHQLVRVEVEVGGLPAVHQHGLSAVPIGVPQEVGPDSPVEPAAHGPKTLAGADQRGLRGGEGGPRVQRPAEVIGMDAQNQTAAFKLAALRRRLEVAAVEEHGPITQAVFLPGIPPAQDGKGIVLVAGGTPDTAHALYAGAQGGPAGTALHHMPPVEGDKVPVSPRQIQAEGGRLTQAHRPLAPVDHPDGTGNQVVGLKDAVEQLHLKLKGGVLQGDNQSVGLRLGAEEGGQALQGVLARPDLGLRKAEAGGVAPVGALHLQGGDAEIPAAAGGILPGEYVQGVGPAGPRRVGVGGEAAVGVLQQTGQVASPDAGAVVGVQEHAVGVRLHLVGGVLGVQSKELVFLIEYDH